jgi:hypothetical protein
MLSSWQLLANELGLTHLAPTFMPEQICRIGHDLHHSSRLSVHSGSQSSWERPQFTTPTATAAMQLFYYDKLKNGCELVLCPRDKGNEITFHERKKMMRHGKFLARMECVNNAEKFTALHSTAGSGLSSFERRITRG